MTDDPNDPFETPYLPDTRMSEVNAVLALDG
jgi:hypothetical protein